MSLPDYDKIISRLEKKLSKSSHETPWKALQARKIKSMLEHWKSLKEQHIN